MNVAKMQLMVLNRKRKDNKGEQIQVTIGGTELNKQCSVRYLGVHIDKDLTWKVPSTNMFGQAGYDQTGWTPPSFSRM